MGKKKYPMVVISECRTCKRIFAWYIKSSSNHRFNSYCGKTCMNAWKAIATKKAKEGIEQTKMKGRRDIDSIQSPSDYEKKLWGK